MRLVDWWLLSPAGRRLRRWSFLVTVPAAIAAALLVGVTASAAVLVGRAALWLAVVGVAWRLRGERGEAVRDLLMHPVARRFFRAELRVLTAPLRLLRQRRGEFSYHRGAEELPLCLALVPAALAEAAVVHLLLPGSWLWVHVGAAALHGYALVWLFGWGMGARLRPHRVDGATLHVHGGLLYGARVPLGAIRSVELARVRAGDRGFHFDGGVALLPARRRVDLRLELSEPVTVTRPLGEPVAVTRLGIAADDPEALAAALRAPALAAPDRSLAGLGAVALVLPDLVSGTSG